MQNSDPRLADIPVALALLTRLPLRLPDHAFERGARAAWAYPLVGVVTGGLAALAGLVTQGLGPWVAAGLALLVATIVTGALHEDGLADSVDGLWGGWDREARLEIMRDSRIGGYGVLALVFAVGLKWAALAALYQAGQGTAALIAAAILSRAAMVGVMQALPHARTDGLSSRVGRPAASARTMAVAIGGGSAVLLAGWAGLICAITAVILAVACARIAQAKIGGQTGDILGATQMVTDIGVLITFLALA